MKSTKREMKSLFETRQRVLLAAAMILFFAIAPQSFACTCRDLSIVEKIELAENIVVATLIEARYVEANPDTAFAKLKIEESLKGTKRGTIEVHTYNPDAGCGLPLELGRVYILFVSRESDDVSVCGGSARLESYDYVDMIREILPK
ncbi:MAG: hypothetical protein OES78_05170 [Chromatiales bacterium]|jgi:hypothetical protein|nr:hypothetical protein [Chromatiales bacterium]